MSKTQQVDDEIHEDQLPSFLVNSPDEEVALSLVENIELDTKDTYEVLVDICAGGASVLTPCERSEDAPHENSVLYHSRTRFGPGTLEQVGNMFPQKDVLGVFPQQVEVCAGPHLRPYHGDEGSTDDLYHSQTERGTIAFHAYATLYARMKNKHYTPAMRHLEGDGAVSSVLTEFLGILDGPDLGVKAAYLDHEFYDSKCLTLPQAHNHVYAMPIVRWGRMIKQELSEGWNCVIQYNLIARLGGHNWVAEPPVYINHTYQNGRYGERGVTRHDYTADVLFIDSPRGARYYYAKRFGIEASYWLSGQTAATTSTQNPVVRLLYAVVSLLLQNVWQYPHWEYVATPR